MKLNVKFGNGDGLVFLGQGYLLADSKKVFVKLYATNSLVRVVVKLYHHGGYGFNWKEAKECGLRSQTDFKNGTILQFNRPLLMLKIECFHMYSIVEQLEAAFKLMDFKLL